MPEPAHCVANSRRRAAAASALLALATLAGCAGGPLASAPAPPLAGPSAAGLPVPEYPPTPRVAQSDVYHGVRVADPWRWLEDLGTPAVRRWVGAENAVSRPYLESLPGRALIQERLSQRGDFERFGAALQGGNSYVLPSRHGGRYFYLHSDGAQDQCVLYVAEALDGPARALLDPNALTPERPVTLADFEVSRDGEYVAYAISTGGSDWKTWRVRATASGADLPDTVRFTKFTPVSWAADGSGFYYSRYPARDAVRGDDTKQVSVWFHGRGTAQADDRLVYAVEDHGSRNPYPEASDDGRWLVLTIADGFAANAVYFLDLTQPGARAARLLDRWDGHYTYLGNAGREFYFLTTASAPRGRVVAIDLDRPDQAAWRTLVAESGDAIDDAHFVGDEFVLNYVSEAHSRVRVHRRDGSLRTEIALPGHGQVTGFDGRAADTETFYAYSDFLTPWTIFHYDLARDQSTLHRRPTAALDPAVYITEQVFYRSRDGTRVPMYLTHRRSMPRDGQQPTLLYGYGGFNVPQLPGFTVPIATWLDLGGVYAVANLRGGGEYGEAWHAAGTRTHKQNVIDDFIAAAEWLIAEHVTSPEHLAIHGRSNGGLLVGAALVQRPDLFAAALPVVGVFDMLRYDIASANARQWSSDYGLAANAEDFSALRAYSPLQNVRLGVCYPPTLITTADHDDRVVPWHSFKFAAALQRAQMHGARCPNPVLLRVEARAGHGAGRPTWMQIEDFADQWAFAAAQTGLRVASP
jgi:prolyl oligopeptidase